ncbi:hypothetical protein SAMN05428962_5124 [Paenibacillus sp. BC26]|nr:hypothetical protein SAMN05428962_5124 [Paenibacillus sp. BC26]
MEERYVLPLFSRKCRVWLNVRYELPLIALKGSVLINVGELVPYYSAGELL